MIVVILLSKGEADFVSWKWYYYFLCKDWCGGDGVLFAERANEFLLQLCLTSKSEGRHRETECEKRVW